MMPNISIRHAVLSELSRIIFVTKVAYKIPYKENTLVTKSHEPENVKDMFLGKEFLALVAVSDNKIIGVARYRVVKNNCLYFFKLAVLKTYRNQSVGSLMVKKIESIAKRKGHTKILLDCAQEKKLPEFYKKLGFKIDTIRKHHDHHDVYMSKKI